VAHVVVADDFIGELDGEMVRVDVDLPPHRAEPRARRGLDRLARRRRGLRQLLMRARSRVRHGQPPHVPRQSRGVSRDGRKRSD
jgi:hypothetical protein